MLVATIQWGESAICIHISPPSSLFLPLPSSHSSRSLQSRAELLVYTADSHWLSIHDHMIVYICQCCSLDLSHPLHPALCSLICSLYLCLYSCPANRFICAIFLHIYDICFSLSVLLHSVQQTLDSSISLQMTQFCSFLWQSNIPLKNVPHFFFNPFICWWTFTMVPYMLDCELYIGRDQFIYLSHVLLHGLHLVHFLTHWK